MKRPIRFLVDLAKDVSGYYARAGQYGYVEDSNNRYFPYIGTLANVATAGAFILKEDEFEFVESIPEGANMGIRAIDVQIKFPDGTSRSVEVIVDAAEWDNGSAFDKELLVVDSVNKLVTYSFSEK